MVDIWSDDMVSFGWNNWLNRWNRYLNNDSYRNVAIISQLSSARCCEFGIFRVCEVTNAAVCKIMVSKLRAFTCNNLVMFWRIVSSVGFNLLKLGSVEPSTCNLPISMTAWRIQVISEKSRVLNPNFSNWKLSCFHANAFFDDFFGKNLLWILLDDTLNPPRWCTVFRTLSKTWKALWCRGIVVIREVSSK